MAQNPIIALSSVNAAGVYGPTTRGAQGDGYASSVMPGGYVNAVNGRTFFGANQAGVTTSVALATTYLGICLSNPAGSTKNLVLRKVGIVFNVVFAAFTSIGLITGWAAGGITVHTTPLTPRSGRVGVADTPIGKLDAACTLVGAGANAPLWARWLTATPAATQSPAGTQFDIDGGIVVPPGGYVATGTLIASPASSFLGSMEWDEVPVLS